MLATLPVEELHVDAFQWLVKYKWWKDEAWMEMSNIDSNLKLMRAWPSTRWGWQLKHTIQVKGDASAEGSLVHRLSNHWNCNTKNNSHDLANEQTGNCIFTTHHKANGRWTMVSSSHITNQTETVKWATKHTVQYRKHESGEQHTVNNWMKLAKEEKQSIALS